MQVQVTVCCLVAEHRTPLPHDADGELCMFGPGEVGRAVGALSQHANLRFAEVDVLLLIFTSISLPKFIPNS